MKSQYSPNTAYSTFSNVQNRKLLKDIEKGKINIRDVLLFAVEKGILPREEYKLMDWVDSWRWLVMNKVDYGETTTGR